MAAMNSSHDEAVPAPWSWTPSDFWDGNDGLWNSFVVQVGTPPQAFRILPSTSGQETWVLNPEGCTRKDPIDCPYSRGALQESPGFLTNESTTWEVEGIYELDEEEQTLGYYGNGLYGFDSVMLGNGSHSLNQTHQVVAGIADKSYYLGRFGLGPKTINFTNFNDPLPNYISNLVNASKIPSNSFGYTAGAAYRDKAPASLTLGGYDTDRFTPSSLSFAMNADNSRPLQVGITKVLGLNTLSGTSNLLPTGTYHFVDSTVSHIWLPSAAADAFAAAFGLTYDNTTDLYLINDTMRNQHLQNKPTVTFVLSANSREGAASTQNIVLPYGAFDLQASYPFYNTSTNYFPIRRAHNTSQYTIGRTFLQEAYLIADWERQNFTLAQARFDDLNSSTLIPILSLAEESRQNQTSTTSTPSPSPTPALSSGVIAGIVVGAVVVLASIALAAFCLISRKRKRRQRAAEAHSAYLEDKKEPPNVYAQLQKDDSRISEMPVPPPDRPAEVQGTTAKFDTNDTHELSGAPGVQEMGHGDSLSGVIPEAMGSGERRRHELASAENRYELDGSGS